MAIKIPTISSDVSPGNAVRAVTWVGLANGDTGDWVRLAEWSGKTFQVYGVLGASGSVSIEGSNDISSPTNSAVLSNWQGTALTATALGFLTARDMPIWVRPHVTAGDGTTLLTVALAAHRQDISQPG